MSEVRRTALLSGVAALPRAEGCFLLDGPTAVLKGMLESEDEIRGIVCDAGPLFQSAIDASLDPDVAEALKRNSCTVLRRRTPERRLVEAGRLAAKTEHGAGVAVILNAEVARAVAALERGGEAARPGTILLVVDDPERHRALASLPLLVGLGLAVLEPRNLDTLRLSIQHAARLAQCVAKPVAIIVDEVLLHSRGMLEVAPNREVETLDTAVALRRRRRHGSREDGDILELARPLDLTRTTAMPSPGEREPLGLISTGVASTAVEHLLEELRLTGRVPTAQLQLVHPIDAAPIERMLSRCERVVLLETRPGRLVASILEIAERLRRRGDLVAELTWQHLNDDGSIVLEPSDAARPSILLRKIAHLLKPVRPSLELGADFQLSGAEVPPQDVPPRRGRREHSRLLNMLQRSVVAADRSLRKGDEDHEPLALTINGRKPVGFAGPVRSVEILERHDLLQQIVPMIASHGDRPWVLVISDSANHEELDAARLVRAAVPSDLPDPPTVQHLLFKSESELCSHVMAASRAPAPSILVVRRAAAPGTLRADLEEIDRLGYAQVERFRGAVDVACGVRARDDDVEDRDVESPSEIPANLHVEQDRTQRPGWFQLRIRPLMEVAEVLRSRPPLPLTPVEGERELPTPSLAHATHGAWRVHVAGTRGGEEGAAASAIVLAGVSMGFDVRSVTNPELVGAGRRAWTQVLFTRSLASQRPAARTAGIPYGEADLLLGVDPIESLRALGDDRRLRVASSARTAFVVNTEPLSDQREGSDGSVAATIDALAVELGRGTTDVRPLGSIVERQFGTDRLLDMVLLGVAFQRGLIPVSTQAITAGVGVVEERGFGRSLEAFEFGRQLVAGARRSRASEPVRTPQSVLREVVLERRFSRGSREALRLRDRLQLALDRMPGLTETEAGRTAAIDFLLATAALVRWGNRRVVDVFVETVEETYRRDRGDTGREMTRAIVLVLGEAFLMRDLPYAAAVALSIDHRRRVRRRLGVRTGRGDAFDIAYIVRADLHAFARRIRMQLPAREWLLRVVVGVGRAMPVSIRGRTIDRQRLACVQGGVARAISESGDPVRYRAWCTAFRRLQASVEDGTFHSLTLSEVEEALST